MGEDRPTPFGPDPDLENRVGQLGDDPEMMELAADTAAAGREAELPGASARPGGDYEADAAATAEQKRQRRYLFRALLHSPTFMIGLIAGFWRGLTDEIIMRLIDVLLALPIIITSILILSLFGKSTAIIIVTIGALFTPVVSRTVRAAVIGEREREYVMAARLRGERSAFVMAREILPNITQPMIVEGTVRLGYAVFTAATLAFLGFGLEPPSPDWGLTISTERAFLQIAPWTVLFPALALASLVVAVNLITDGLGRTFSK